MQQAAVPGYRLSKAKFSTRVLTTLGLIGLFSGLLGAAILTISTTGLSADEVRLYYLGTQGAVDARGGGELEGLLAPSMGRPIKELLEVTHLHLMGGSMLLFMLCHLLSVCDVPDRLRVVLYSASFASFLATFTLPWFIIFLSPRFAAGFAPSVIVFIMSLAILCLIPVREMWFRR